MEYCKNSGMIAFIPTQEESFDFLEGEFPSKVKWKHNRNVIAGALNSTSYLYVTKGKVNVKIDDNSFILPQGWYGSFLNETEITGEGHSIISTRIGYQGLNQFGGAVERLGRLQYIDGCSSTLLLSAPRLGDPCFNYLHVPCNIDQTAHTHPTLRVGYILEGSGIVRLERGSLDLVPGMMFCLLPDVIHSFHTKDSELRIVIYHPDSDFGPSDEVHPMLNKTIIEGVSARYVMRK